MPNRYPRLSLYDRAFLRIEERATPQHFAGLCVVEGGPLLNSTGDCDMELVRRRLEGRLVRAPELRQMVQRTKPLCGPPLWLDDPGFSIDRHIRTATIAPPGDEASLFSSAELLLRPMLDRCHPLWELWLLTGLEGGRVGLLFKIHHALADGLAAVALISSFFDDEPGAADLPTTAWRPAPMPASRSLLVDNVHARLGSVGSTLAHPARLAHRLAAGIASSPRPWAAAAPRTSLNARVGEGRRLRVVHLDLETARATAHSHGAKVNDVVLSVVAGGVRDLLVARGDKVDGLELVGAVPAAMRSAQAARQLGNAAGALAVRLPPVDAVGGERVELTAARTRAAKLHQRPANGQGLFGWMAAVGLFQLFVRRQRMFNFFVSNVPGPSAPLYVLGARIEQVMPILATVGNLTLVFATLSYCGRLDLVVSADAAACPDVDVLACGMTREWQEMTQVTNHRQVAAVRRSA
jgi:diacylglycerol O-acyltransferase / wax synthase